MPKARLKFLLAAASISAALLLVVLWATASRWLPALAAKQLAGYGITVQAIDIERLGFHESRIGYVQLLAEDKGTRARLENIRIGYRLQQLWEGRLDHVEIEHADLSIRPAASPAQTSAATLFSPAEILEKVPLDHFGIKRLDLAILGSDNAVVRKLNGKAEFDKRKLQFELRETQSDRPLSASATLDDSGSMDIDLRRKEERLLALKSVMRKTEDRYLTQGSLDADLKKLSEEAAIWTGADLPQVTGELKAEWQGFLPGNTALNPETLRTSFKGTSSLTLDARAFPAPSTSIGARLNLQIDYESGLGRWRFQDRSFLSFLSGNGNGKIETSKLGGKFRVQPGLVRLEVAQGAALKSDRLLFGNGEISGVTASLVQPLRLDFTSGKSWHQTEISGILVHAGKLETPSFSLAGMQATLHLDALAQGSVAGSIDAKATHPAVEAARLPDCRIASNFKLAHGVLNTTGSLTAGENKLHVNWSAAHRLSSSSGQADYSLLSARLGRSGLDIGTILARKSLPEISGGEISGAGKVTWQLQHKTGKLQLRHEEELDLKSLGGKYDSYSLAGLSGQFRMSGTDKDLGLSWNKLTIDAIKVGAPLKNLSVQGNIQLSGFSNLKMSLGNFSGDVLGGKVSARQIDIDLARPHNPFVVELRQIDARQLVELQNQEGLYADGILDGSLPADWTKNGLYISNGELKARPPGGVIRYLGNSTVRSMASGNQAVKMALDILSDFRYHLLQLDVDAEADGNTRLGIHLKGRNPAYENGRPIEFNLNVEQNFLKLLQSLSMANRISERLEKKIQKQMGN